MKKRFELRLRDHIHDPAKKPGYTRALFSELAGEYDRVTPILSFGRDAAWKRAMVAVLPEGGRPVCLDLACGTGDLTVALALRYPGGRVIGLDLAEPMLARARARTAAHPNVEYLCADMTRTGLPDASVDIVTGGYALRNAPDTSPAVAEVARVLRPGGAAIFLDFSNPSSASGRRISYLLLKVWCGMWGWLLHRRAEMYAYVAESMLTMPDRRRLHAMLAEAGLQVVSNRRHYFGMLETIVCVRA